MKNNNNFKISDYIPSILYKNSTIKKDKSIVANHLDKTLQNLKKNKDVFHSLSDSFYLELDKEKLKKFKKYKTVVVIGMGGSILGSEAIYQTFKNKIKKNFYFLTI